MPEGLEWRRRKDDGLNREYQIRENGSTTGAGVLAVYQYDSLSRKQLLTRDNGASTSFTIYDLASRLGTLAHDVAGTAQDISLGFTYTMASQLHSRSSSNASYDWLPGASNIAYVPDGLNRYATVAGATYAYDGRGNMTSDGTNTYSYDVENRLLTASGPTAVTLTYDSLGRLQQTMVGTTPTQYLYDGTKLIAEYDGSGNVLRRYVHGPGSDDPVVWYEGSTLVTRFSLHTDERGSVIAASDNSGSASANVYTYVGNDPLDKTDPTGEQTYLPPESGPYSISINSCGGDQNCVKGVQEGFKDLAIFGTISAVTYGLGGLAVRGLVLLGRALGIINKVASGVKAGVAIERTSLSGAQAKNLARFESKLPANSGPPTTFALSSPRPTAIAPSP